MKHWFIAGGVTAVVLMFATCSQDSDVIENNQVPESKSTQKDLSNSKQLDAHQHTNGQHNHSHDMTVHQTNNPHYEQLTPEMKQALKDSLLLENDTETFTKDDGTVVLPANGRSTQVSVAVQMPDGTIQIREYSNIPKAPPKYKISNGPKK